MFRQQSYSSCCLLPLPAPALSLGICCCYRLFLYQTVLLHAAALTLPAISLDKGSTIMLHTTTAAVNTNCQQFTPSSRVLLLPPPLCVWLGCGLRVSASRLLPLLSSLPAAGVQRCASVLLLRPHRTSGTFRLSASSTDSGYSTSSVDIISHEQPAHAPTAGLLPMQAPQLPIKNETRKRAWSPRRRVPRTTGDL